MTSSPPSIRIRIDEEPRGRVAWLIVDNQAKLNILGAALIGDLNQTLDKLFDDKSVRAVVLTGAGVRAFIGGADIREMVGFDGDRARDFITDLHGLCRRLRDFPVPTLARIDGYCLGAGMEIAASCDLRAATTNAKFGMPEVRVGLPSVIEAAVLPGLVGWGKARELVLTGDIIDATEAQAIGFVERLVAPSDLDQAIDRWLESILAAGPHAIHDQKILLRRWQQLDLEQRDRDWYRRLRQRIRNRRTAAHDASVSRCHVAGSLSAGWVQTLRPPFVRIATQFDCRFNERLWRSLKMR